MIRFLYNDAAYMLIALQIIIGLLLLIVGNELLVRGSVILTKQLKVPLLFISLIVITSASVFPSLIISIQANLSDNPEIAFGSIVGRNIANILLMIGIAAIINPITLDKQASKHIVYFLSVITILISGMAYMGQIGLIAGSLLITILVIYTYYSIKTAIKTPEQLPEHNLQLINKIGLQTLTKQKSLSFCILSIILLIISARLLIKGASELAIFLERAESVTGTTIVALSAALPSFIAIIILSARNRPEFVISTIVGNNILNIIAVLGFTSILQPLTVAPNFLIFDIPVMLVSTLALCALIYFCTKISRPIGILLFLAYIAYVTIQYS